MRSRLVLTATVLALAPVLAPAVASAVASAQIVERKDATGDVRSINQDNHQPGDPATVVPE